MAVADTPRAPLPIYSIALLSASALAYEVLLMKLFSIIQWHHFAYMVISLALLGYGVSGTFLALARRRLLANFPHVFIMSILLFGVTSMGCFLLAQGIPLHMEQILWDPWQLPRLSLIYLLLALPFFCAATAIGLALSHYRAGIAPLYGADLLGAGLGSIAIVVLLFLLYPATLLQVIPALALTAAAIAAWELKQSPHRVISVLLVTALAPLLLPAQWLAPEISPYKGLSQQMQIQGSRIVAERSSPLGLLTVVENPLFPLRHAPGLSINAGTEPPQQLAVFTDGDGMTVLTRQVDDIGQLGYLDQMTSALPYHLADMQRVLILGAGGGSDVLQARYHRVTHIDAVELNRQMIELVNDTFADFTGALYRQPGIVVHAAEARGFISATDKQYDLIQLSLLDSFSAAAAGLHALNESHLYTVEALQEYYRRLRPQGMIAITRWVTLPPRDTLKLFATAIAALRDSGISNPREHLALIRGWQTSTLLVRNGPFSAQELEALRQFCRERAFDVEYYPGITAEETNRYNVLNEPVFFSATQELLSARARQFLRDYKFDITPATDDRPYFFHFFKWRLLPEIIALRGQGGALLVEWGYLILVVTLLQAALISVVLIVLPLLFSRRTAIRTHGGNTLAVFGYFTALGLAFLFIEIAFIQKFILFLHHPLYATPVVLCAFLVFAGLGSLFSQRYRHDPATMTAGIRKAVTGIVIAGALYIMALGALFDALTPLPSLAKIAISILIIAPLAFCMGMPFPTGLAMLGDREAAIIPWAWGINGCASVISAMLATLLAIHLGFAMVVLMALLLYLMAAFIAPRL